MICGWYMAFQSSLLHTAALILRALQLDAGGLSPLIGSMTMEANALSTPPSRRAAGPASNSTTTTFPRQSSWEPPRPAVPEGDRRPHLLVVSLALGSLLLRHRPR